MFFEHIYDKSLAQGSYLVGCQATGEAVVIDPKRDIDTYLEIAERNNLNITHVTETHIHADFLSGTRELAKVTDAKVYLSDEGGSDWSYTFPHVGLKDKDKITVGNLSLEVMHTPGHTPESISFLLVDHPASAQPTMIFTGDFVFVGDVGRPDLLEEAAGIKGTKEKGAKEMFQSVQKFKQLPDYIQVWPGHGAGSACGKALGAVPSSTVGYEKIQNWALQFDKDEEKKFVEALLADQPEPPKYFAMMKHLNKEERSLLTEVPTHQKLSKEQFLKAYHDGMKVIDTRPKDLFKQGFLPQTIHIEGNNSLATWAGWLLNYDEQFILIAEEDQMEDLTRKLMRIGLDNIYGFISNVHDFDIDLEKMPTISLDEMKAKVQQKDVQIVDVRGASEFKEGHIKGSDHIFVGTIGEHLDEISKEKEIVIQCLSGGRAVIAYSILLKNGFKNVQVFLGGMEAWSVQKEPIVA